MGRIVDGYTNIGTLKLFAHARREQSYVREGIEELVVKHRAQTRVTTVMDTAIALINGGLIVGTCGLALWLWSRGQITVGAITLATGLVIRIHNMSGWIMWTVNGIFENIGTVQDGIESIAQPTSVRDAADAQPLVVTQGDVRFENIHFHYGKRGGVIAGLDLHVRAGEKIGLVGPSGAGKSTLVNVLLRLYDLESGRILIDGQDIGHATQESLRAHIGVVTQDTSLLHRSIRDNLLYGRPDASEAQLGSAVRKARADVFIEQLVDGEGRQGYAAHVGERGRDALLKTLRGYGVPIEVELRDLPGGGVGAALVIVAECENGIGGWTGLGERGKPMERVAEGALHDFQKWFATSAAVDEHLSDQLVLPCALIDGEHKDGEGRERNGESRWTTPTVTEHLRTVLAIVKKFLPITYRIEERTDGSGLVSLKGVRV